MKVPTMIFFAKPNWFLKELPQDFDLVDFNERYEWEQDPLNGFMDIAEDPINMIENKKGDCDDYARIAASYLFYRTNSEISIHMLIRKSPFETDHMVVFDGNNVYSNGNVLSLTPEEYKEEEGYDYNIVRKIR